MEENKVDRRVRKTKRQLQQALANRLAEKSLSHITVKELCDLVDINRSTFYAHYQDVYDLMEQMEAYVCEQFQFLVDRHPMDAKHLDIYPMEVEIFEFLIREKEIASVLLGEHGTISFVQQIHHIIMEYFEIHWHKFIPEDIVVNWQYSFHFVVSGCIGLMQQWLAHGMKESKEEMANIMSSLVSSGLHGYSEQILSINL